MHQLAHVLGLDSQNTAFYMFWSGCATQLSVVAAVVGAYWKHRCHRCPRIGRHQHGGTPFCSRHRPPANPDQ